MSYKKHLAVLVSGIMLLITGMPITYAASKGEDEIRFRQSGYMFMRWNMGRIKKNVIKDPENFNQQEVIAAASAIHAIVNSGIEKLFTEKSKTGDGWKPTRVKSAFFDNPDDVRSLFVKLEKQSHDMVNAAQSGDISQIKIRFKDVLQTCKSCHKQYREK